jgi:hypothetical protein
MGGGRRVYIHEIAGKSGEHVNTNTITITNQLTNTIAENGLEPEDDLYTAVSIGEDIDKLSNR